MGDCYCPQTEDVKVHNVLHQPTGEQLVSIIVTAIEDNGNYANAKEENAYRRLAKHMKRATPNTQWMLGLLSTMTSDHEVFKKGYRPPARRQQAMQAEEEMIPLREGFFDGLDILSAK